MKPKRKPRSTASKATPKKNGAVRIGYDREAQAVFDALPAKVQEGLDRKLRDFAANPGLGKPLVGDLLGYHRVLYGRIRTVSLRATAKVVDGLVVVFVLEVGLRKEGSREDPYVLARRALKRGDVDAQHAVELIVASFLKGDAPELEENETP